MAGAVWLARKLDRTLIVDWRGQAQLKDKSTNYFSAFFETPPEILGVPVLYAPVDIGDYGVESPQAHWVSPGEAHLLASGQAQSDAAFVVCQDFHGLDRMYLGSDADRFRLLRAFYRVLRAAPFIRDAADAWWTEHCEGAFVVGVNVRTGNGQYFGKGMQYAGRVDVAIFEDEERFVRKLKAACCERAAALPKALRDDFLVFCATDSVDMSRLLGRLPRAITRRSTYPPAGAGDLYAFDGAADADRRSVAETIVDMFLLARCDALVYNSSVFNQYARVVSGYFSGNLVHIESLFAGRRTRVAAGALRRRLRG
jgi:hypothetical protein